MNLPTTLSFWALLSLPGLSQQIGPQEPPPPVERPRMEDFFGKWIPLDRVVIVVNGDIITQRKITRKMDEVLGKVKNTTREDLRQLQAKTQRDEVESLLIRQAGEDMGLPPEAVEAHVTGTIRDDLDEAGGSFAMARQYREGDTTALEVKEDRIAEIYESSWRRRIAGMGSGQERTPEDNYIRPGLLVQTYRRIQRFGRDIHYLERVGAIPATYDLQVLLITPESTGSLEAARQKAEEVHAALQAGQVDWDEIIDTLGSFENRGLIGPQRIENLERGLDPGNGRLVQFAMGGQEDSLSPVIQFPSVNFATGERTLAGYAIYKHLGRSPATVPDFSTEGVQFHLRYYLEDEARKARWDDAVIDLERTAYIWYPAIEAQKEARKAAAAKRAKAIQEARDRNAERMRSSNQQAPERAATDS